MSTKPFVYQDPFPLAHDDTGGYESEHHGHPRIANQQQGGQEDGTKDGAEAPVIPPGAPRRFLSLWSK
jgi:hypothetical protein